MKFVDEAIITVQSGNGGRGCVSFRREKFIERGGPDGGDGGDGGDVILKASQKKRTLYEFRFQHTFSAKNGGYGQGNQKHGRNGQTITLEVPLGTIVTDVETGCIIKDFIFPDEEIVIAKGGMGGRGNKHFATSTNRAPRFAQPGMPGQTLKLKLELKLIADVGIIGFPNAGKSTLISVISSARPKIGDYPFTKITPNIGMVRTDWGEPFAVADIPGLIEGAHEGVGLGMKFLRHIERTRILVHLIDASSIEIENPLSQYETINEELSLYSDTLSQKPQIVVLNKMDLPESTEKARIFREALPDIPVLGISAVTTKGIQKLKQRLQEAVSSIHENEPENVL